MKFSLPIYQSSGQPYKSADDLLKRLARETAGTYLVGKSNFWHGGIHVTDKIAPHCVKNDMVRCMADGTVVAYRINADYLQSECMGETLKYSTGFVLVRHDYKSAENSEEGPNKGKRNELTFYSLYMHVAPFSVYGGYAGKSVYKITADNLRARTEASLSGAEIGFLKTGAEIEVQETREVVNGNQKYLFARATLKSGAIRNGNAVVDQGSNPFWVAIEQTSPAVKKFAIPQAQKVPELPFYLQGKCIAKTKGEVNARTNDSGTEDSIHGKLPAGTELTFDRSQEKTIAIKGTRYRFAPCTIQRCAAPDWESWPSPLWVSVEERFVDIIGIQPDHLDEVVACHVSAKAGDKLARLGLYESTASLLGGKNSKHLVHVEMFSFDPGLESFLKNSAGLTQGGKFLRLEKGHKLHKKSGSAEAVEFVEDDKALSRMAVVPLSGLKKHKDKAGKQWLEVEICDKAGNLKGFVEEDGANLVSQHDWANLGFQTVRAPEAFDGHLARMGIHPFYKELYQKIADEPAPEDRDKIRAALTHADNCAVWSKIVARHPSEWKHPSGHRTWSVLDKLLRSAPELLDHEKERIDKCVWWDDVAGKVPGFDRSGVVWHFHPVGVVSHLGSAVIGKITVQMLRKIFEGTSAEQEGFLSEIAVVLNENASNYKVDSALRLSHFFAQVREEVGPACRLAESFNYSVDALKQKFRYFRTNPQEAEAYGRKSGQSANQVEIANRAYNGVTGNRGLGNGNIASGDGWRYKGRGLVQLTGRANYDDFTRRHKEVWNESVDFLEAPELLETARYAVRSAVGFWLREKLYEIADAGSSADQVNAITEVINRYTNSYPNRVSNFNRIYHAQKIFSEVD